MNRSRFFGSGTAARSGVAGSPDVPGLRGSAGSPRSPGFSRRLVGVLLTGVLLTGVFAGCQTADPDRHGAGEKLTETADRDGNPGAADRSDAEQGAGGDTDAGDDGLAGGRLPDLELSWLRPPEPSDPASGKTDAQDADAKDADAADVGDPVRLRALAGGEPLVINVWAVWCTPCRDEIPHLQRLSEQAGDRLRVIGVDHDDDPDAANDLLDELGVDYPQVADPDAELRAPFRLGIGIPVTVYVRPDGEIAHVARTPYRSLEQLRTDVERYLGVSV